MRLTKISVAVALLALLSAGLLLFLNVDTFQKPTPRPDDPGEQQKHLSSPMLAEEGDSNKQMLAQHTNSDPQGSVPARLVVVEQEQLSPRAAANLALSVEEALWLRQNGYPSAWELENLESLDWASIEVASGRGDEVAQNLKAERLVASGDVVLAAAMFGNPRGMDSPYALMRSAELQALEGRYGREEDNYTGFMLYAQFAMLMGDHQAEYVIRSVLPGTIHRQRLQASVLPSLPGFVLSRFDLAARTGLPPPRPSSRPNAEQWRQARIGTTPVVTVQLPSPYARRPGG